MSLPIDAVLGDLLESLRDQPNAVLIAPPGAGKTTGVAPASSGSAWIRLRKIPSVRTVILVRAERLLSSRVA